MNSGALLFFRENPIFNFPSCLDSNSAIMYNNQDVPVL